jgi:pyruvate,orthophosphate dikinase
MMGHRGCRLAVTYPEIAKMQTKAVIRAAINTKKAHPDWNVEPEIMIPLVSEALELKYVKKFVVETADAEIAAAGIDLKYQVGTMIEIPRAALTADVIAKDADFFCFGTNDLTQMTYGFSRDDAGKFLQAYYENKIFENDPFARIDQDGVGKLMELSIKLGKPVNPALHIGICGEHGGDPTSVEFCHKIGLDYVSCSPFRVPIARLAAAQAAIEYGKGGKLSVEEKIMGALGDVKDKAMCAAGAAKDFVANNKDSAKETAKDIAKTGKDLAKDVVNTGVEVAKAGIAGAKVGWEEAKKVYTEGKNN